MNLIVVLCSSVAAAQDAPAPLSTASAEELLRVYQQLRNLRAGDQWAIAENVVWKRDAGTFTFRDGRFTFAAPVHGRVVAAVFVGQGTFELDPPTLIARRQISRFTGGPKLEEGFRKAVFFFTDDSWSEVQKLMRVQGNGDPQAAAKAFESTQERFAQRLNRWWENLRKGNFPVRNLAARMLADLSDPKSRGFFLADIESERQGDLLFHISWNRDSLVLPGFANDEEVLLVRYRLNQYFEWWAGFHLAGEYRREPFPEHRELVARCRQQRIEAELNSQNRLSAQAEMEVEVPGGPLRLLPLNLEGVLRIRSLVDGAGNNLAFIQEARNLDSDPWVILPQPATANQMYKLRIAYEEDSTHDSRIVHQQGSGLYYVTARSSWFPSFGAFDDRTRFFLRFRSPKKFKLLGTGRLVKSEKREDFFETEWESEIPYGVVGFNYGDFVEGTQSETNLNVTAYAGKEIPDELKGLQAAIDIAELSLGEGHGDVASRAGIATGGFNTSRMAGYAAAISFRALKLFEFYFGPLPFKSISVTEQPIIGYAQSWPTLIFLPYDTLLDSTTRQSLRLQRSAEAREFYNVVAVHEMAHQWWGHVVGWKTYHDQWLSEGFAEYSAALYLRKYEPKEWKGFWDLKRKWLLSSNKVGRRPVDVGPLWLNYQLNAHLEENNSIFLIYYKGAYVLEMIRAIMEDPQAPNPDGRFIAMLRDFVSTYSGKNPSTENFRRIVEKYAGEPMDWFFNQWVYGTEVPHYDFSYQLKSAADGKTTLEFSIKQSGVSDSFAMKVPVYAYLKGSPQRLGFLGVTGSNTVTGSVPLPFRPEKVVLDPNQSILCTIRQ